MNSIQPDAYHGMGGTYVMTEDGRRVPSDPVTGAAMAEPNTAPDLQATTPPAESTPATTARSKTKE